MAQLSLRNIVKTYDTGANVIKGIDLDVMDGEFMVFIGASGCGKSTLLRMIAGLEDVTSGDMLIDGTRINDVPAAQRGIAMVFQSYALYPHMTVAQNMGYALKLAGGKSAEVAAAVGRAAEVLQITHLLDRKPRALSGGQRQRVAIGRAIVRKPRVFLFDEPLSNLDASLRVQMRTELLRLHQELGTTMVYVTHDQVEAMTLGHRIAVFNGGRIEQVGAPMALYASPANSFVAGFLGSPKMNLVLAAVTEASDDRIQLRLPDGALLVLPGSATGLRAGDACTLGFRPDQASLRPAHGHHDGALTGHIELIERLGEATLVHVRCAGTAPALIVSQPGHLPPPPIGQHVALTPDVHRVRLFDRDGQAIDSLPAHVPAIEKNSHEAVPASQIHPFRKRSSP
jgi:multiple sugar transport system ATP-binding protein